MLEKNDIFVLKDCLLPLLLAVIARMELTFPMLWLTFWSGNLIALCQPQPFWSFDGIFSKIGESMINNDLLIKCKDTRNVGHEEIEPVYCLNINELSVGTVLTSRWVWNQIIFMYVQTGRRGRVLLTRTVSNLNPFALKNKPKEWKNQSRLRIAFQIKPNRW